MKRLIALVASLLVAAPALAQVKPCEELKAEIDAKIKANGVKVFSLEIVPNADVKEGEGKVVGSCEGSTHKIVYKRGVAEAPAAPAASASAPAPAAPAPASQPQTK
jgi:hypothetical protein